MGEIQDQKLQCSHIEINAKGGKKRNKFYKIHTFTKPYVHMNTCPPICTFSIKHKMQNNILK